MITIQTINPGSFNRDRARELGFAQWGAAFIDINEHEAGDQRYIRAYFTDAAPVTQNQVDAFVLACGTEGLVATAAIVDAELFKNAGAGGPLNNELSNSGLSIHVSFLTKRSRK